MSKSLSTLVLATLVTAVTIIVVVSTWWYISLPSPEEAEPNPIEDTAVSVVNAEQSVREEVVTPSPTRAESAAQPVETTTVWQTYRSNLGFTIDYPAGWQVVDEFKPETNQFPNEPRLQVSFGTGRFGDGGYDGEMFVFVYNRTAVNLENLIKTNGKQFTDRKEIRESITVAGLPATKVVVTTPSRPDWKFEGVYMYYTDRLLLMHQGANPNKEFEKFYNSVRFVP